MKTPAKKLILALETSCDETAASILSINLRRQNLPVFSPQYSSFSEKLFSPGSKFRGENAILLPKIKTLSAVVKSQINLHRKMGGVVPEAAARAHVKNILPVTQKALVDAKIQLEKIDYIAITHGPGLIPSLIVGVEFAKALALATGKPIIPVNHMAGHLYSPLPQIKKQELKLKAVFPQIALIVSGGHTMLVLMTDLFNYKVLGQTVDDAAGEAFDKVAKLLQLPYPGGPEVSKLAEQGQPEFAFPRPMMHTKDYNFSFAGLKTAVLYHLRDHPNSSKADICKAFQDAVIDVLIAKTLRAAEKYQAKSVSLSGGVAANIQLRAQLAEQCRQNKLLFFVPAKSLTTDNAEMIGLAACINLSQKVKLPKLAQIKADPNLQL